MASLAQHNAGQKLPGIFWYSIILSQGKYGLGWTRNMNTCIYWRRIFVIYMNGQFNDKHIIKCNPELWYVWHIYLFVGIIQKYICGWIFQNAIIGLRDFSTYSKLHFRINIIPSIHKFCTTTKVYPSMCWLPNACQGF